MKGCIINHEYRLKAASLKLKANTNYLLLLSAFCFGLSALISVPQRLLLSAVSHHPLKRLPFPFQALTQPGDAIPAE